MLHFLYKAIKIKFHKFLFSDFKILIKNSSFFYQNKTKVHARFQINAIFLSKNHKKFT